MHENFYLNARCYRRPPDYYSFFSFEIINNPPSDRYWTSFQLEPFSSSPNSPQVSITVLNETLSWLYHYKSNPRSSFPDSIIDIGGLSFCSHTKGSFSVDNADAVTDSTCLDLSIDPKLWFNGHALSDLFGTLNATETTCSLFLCNQRVVEAKLENNRFSAQGVSSNRMSNKIASELPDNMFCSGRDENCPYPWTQETLDLLASRIVSTIDTEDYFTMLMTQKNGPGNNYTLLYERIAAQLSAILQSQANPSIANITGIAYGTEIYVQVNWLWFILPLVLLASCLLILVLSIWDSSRKDYLFKNNILAALAFELHGWEPHEYGVDETWTRHNMRNVEQKAERMVARMQLPHEGDGGLRLKRE
jgi:hypothetical protein